MKKFIDESKIINLYVTGGLSGRKISKRLEYALTTIQRVLKKYNVTRNLKEARANLFQKGYKSPLKKELDEKKIIESYLENKSISAIAKLFDCSHGTISKVLKENNVPIKNAGYFNKGKSGFWTNKKRPDISAKLKGIKRSDETKEKLRLSHLGQKSNKKGKTLEEIYGTEKSKELNKKLVKSHLGISSHRKGKSFEEEFGKDKSENIKSKIREKTLQQYVRGDFPKQENTNPERKIKAELIKKGYKEEIDFIHQFKFMNKFMCDFCFPKQKIIIEVNGDFWHANPEKYAGKELHPHQIKGINRDKTKEAYIKKVDNNSWTFLSFWESDIKKDVSKCVNKIEEIMRLKEKNAI
ncbi:hypothetical protein HYS72_02805 [Candidatus Pacearchaeota archaeon]|nr:hypothetical protein [Candidatus Pacearchaeota archaeon]